MTPTPTEQRPQECEHYHEGVAACELCGYHNPKCNTGYCSDYQPKEKKDNDIRTTENN